LVELDEGIYISCSCTVLSLREGPVRRHLLKRWQASQAATYSSSSTLVTGRALLSPWSNQRLPTWPSDVMMAVEPTNHGRPSRQSVSLHFDLQHHHPCVRPSGCSTQRTAPRHSCHPSWTAIEPHSPYVPTVTPHAMPASRPMHLVSRTTTTTTHLQHTPLPMSHVLPCFPPVPFLFVSKRPWEQKRKY
jgi:hypothetical protein